MPRGWKYRELAEQGTLSMGSSEKMHCAEKLRRSVNRRMHCRQRSSQQQPCQGSRLLFAPGPADRDSELEGKPAPRPMAASSSAGQQSGTAADSYSGRNLAPGLFRRPELLTQICSIPELHLSPGWIVLISLYFKTDYCFNCIPPLSG